MRKNSLKTGKTGWEEDKATTPEVQTTQKQIQETKTQILAKQQKRERERERGTNDIKTITKKRNQKGKTQTLKWEPN